jgi:DNA replication initiation complex subunit (GINS family)
MAQETMHKMIGRALTDRQFREELLRSPLEATHDLPLTSQERELIASVHATSLEEFSRKLKEQLPESRERRHYAGAEAA